MDLVKFYSVINKIEGHGGLGMKMPEGTARFVYGLTRAMNVKTYVDVGTFVGYTCLWAARAMEENGLDGKVYTVELNRKWLDMAKQFAKAAGLSHRIEFVLGNSLDFLPNLKVPSVDLVLFDSGDKDLYKKDFENLENRFTGNTIIIAHDIIQPERVPFKSAWGFKAYIDSREGYKAVWLDCEYGSLLIQKRSKYEN